jgi:hypothetical protein
VTPNQFIGALDNRYFGPKATAGEGGSRCMLPLDRPAHERAPWTSCVASKRSSEAKQPTNRGVSAPRGARRTPSKAPLLPIKGSGPDTGRGKAG